MAKTLNDTQRSILAAAAARDNLCVLPLPSTLKAPKHIVTKSLTRMIEDGLIAEITALPEDQAWTESPAGGRVTLVTTPQGLAAIGIEGEPSPAEAQGAAAVTSPRKGGKGAARASVGEGGGKQTKQDIVLAMLRRPQGASVPEMVAATGWQPHSVRGFMSGALKKRLSIEVTSEKGENDERRYHVSPLKPAERDGAALP